MKALSSDRIFQGVLQTESFTEEDIAKFCDASVNLVNYPDGYKMEKDGRNEAGRKMGSDIRENIDESCAFGGVSATVPAVSLSTGFMLGLF